MKNDPFALMTKKCFELQFVLYVNALMYLITTIYRSEKVIENFDDVGSYKTLNQEHKENMTIDTSAKH